MNPAVPYTIPPQPGRWPAIMLAALMHAVLFGFLWFGVRWQNEVPVAVEAEVWDMHVRQAAPKAPRPDPVPEVKPDVKPIIKPIIKPEVKPEVKPIAKPEVQPDKPTPPDIALEQEKKRLAKKLKAEQEKLKLVEAQIKADAQKEKIKEAKEAKEEKKRQQEANEAAKKLADKKADDKLEKKKLALQLANQQRVKDAADQAKIEKEHAANMARITGATGSGGNGDAPKSTGPRGDPSYAAAIKAKIKSNISYGGDIEATGNPRAVFRIDQLPNGEIIGIKKLTSSGVASFDDAVEKAISKSSPLPKKKDGTVEREIEATFNLKE
jgi:colicin import membrane protein